jgi:hypothetical protein
LSIKDMIDLLSPADRKTALVLGLLALSSVVFFLMVPLNKKAAYTKFQQTAGRNERRLTQMESDRTEKLQNRNQWLQTENDIQTLGASFVYTNDSPTEMRLDVEKILRDNGIKTPPIEYDYEDYPEEGFKKIRMGFVVTAPYYGLRKIIHSFETFPKFLVLERIEFLDIDERGVSIRVRLRLAGYYKLIKESEAGDEADL